MKGEALGQHALRIRKSKYSRALLHEGTWWRSGPYQRIMHLTYRLRPAALALALTAFGLGVPRTTFADTTAQGPQQPPLHPTLITTEYKGKVCTVMNAKAEFPVVDLEGSPKPLYGKQSYQPMRAVGFSPGFVRFKNQHASSRTINNSVRLFGTSWSGTYEEVPAGQLSSEGSYHCTLIASEGHSDTYIAVIFYRLDPSGTPDLRSAAIAFREIGDLQANVEKDVTINCAYVAPPGKRYFHFPLVFAKGREIRTDQSEKIALFFRKQEMEAHRSILKEYRKQFATADKPPVPYLRIPPVVPSGVNAGSIPSTVKASFTVTEDGEVDGITLDQALDPQVSRELRRALGGWLFLPCLRKGYPVSVPVETSLSFGATPG